MGEVIKKERVRLGDAHPPAGARKVAPRAAAQHAKRVEVIRVDGRVKTIELRCACGETSVIELEYDDETPGTQP